MSSRSLREPSLLDVMVQFPQEGLVLRLPPAKPVDADPVPIEVHLHSHQPLQPVWVHLEAPAQHLHRPRRTGPPQVDDPAPWSGLEVQSPSLREGTPPRGRLDAVGSVATKGRYISLRSLLQVRQRDVLEPGPDLRLSGAVVVLDRRLEAELMGHDEHRHHAQAQAQPTHPPHHVRVGVRALEDRVVVELGVAGQAERPPMLDQRCDHDLGRHARLHRERGGQSSVQGDAVEYLDLGPSLMTSPSTTSKLSSSRPFEMTSGRYQPGGGAGRRVRLWPSRAPRRSRMRLMVRTEGSGSNWRPLRASWMASAPWNPRSLACSNSHRTVRTRSSMAVSVRVVDLGVLGRSCQSTRSSRWRRACWTQ